MAACADRAALPTAIMCIFCEMGDRTADHSLSDAQVLAAEACSSLGGRLPVTVVTGFLGSGKTTLVNWMLMGSHGKRFCVVQNEFGAEPIDDSLIVRSERFAEVAVLTLASGCVCCKVRGDLADTLKALARSEAAARGPSDPTGAEDASVEEEREGEAGGGRGIDWVVIETSGLSEVAPVCQARAAGPDMHPRRSTHVIGIGILT